MLAVRGPTTGRRQVGPSCITGEPVSREDVDHALVDGIMGCVLWRCEPEMRDQRARGAAVRSDDRVLFQPLLPLAYLGGPFGVTFVAPRAVAPTFWFSH